MGYSEDSEMVRVDFFKPSGKWYTTEAIKWLDYEGWDLPKILRESIKTQNGNRLSDMIAVCLNPYSKFEHPVMIFPEDKK